MSHDLHFFLFWHVFTKFRVVHKRFLPKQIHLMNLVWLPHNFTLIPHSSCCFFSIRYYNWKLGIVFSSCIFFYMSGYTLSGGGGVRIKRQYFYLYACISEILKLHWIFHYSTDSLILNRYIIHVSIKPSIFIYLKHEANHWK